MPRLVGDIIESYVLDEDVGDSAASAGHKVCAVIATLAVPRRVLAPAARGQCKGDGRSRKANARAMEGRGTPMQGDGRSRKANAGRWKVTEGQCKAMEGRGRPMQGDGRSMAVHGRAWKEDRSCLPHVPPSA